MRSGMSSNHRTYILWQCILARTGYDKTVNIDIFQRDRNPKLTIAIFKKNYYKYCKHSLSISKMWRISLVAKVLSKNGSNIRQMATLTSLTALTSTPDRSTCLTAFTSPFATASPRRIPSGRPDALLALFLCFPSFPSIPDFPFGFPFSMTSLPLACL